MLKRHHHWLFNGLPRRVRRSILTTLQPAEVNALEDVASSRMLDYCLASGAVGAMLGGLATFASMWGTW